MYIKIHNELRQENYLFINNIHEIFFKLYITFALFVNLIIFYLNTHKTPSPFSKFRSFYYLQKNSLLFRTTKTLSYLMIAFTLEC